MDSGFRVIALAALGALVASGPAFAGPPAEQGTSFYALVVANNASLDRSRAPLQYADDDGAAYFELLEPQVDEALLLAVLDDDTQRRHPGLAARARPPTRRELLAAVDHLATRMEVDRKAGRKSVLYFVYAGHGQRNAVGEGSITLLDGLFGRTDLFDQVVSRLPATFIHLIVDACDSYLFVHARGALSPGPSYAAAITSSLSRMELQRWPQLGLVLSTTREQESHEWSAIRSGVFSHQVRSALSGAADVNGDGRVEYSELAAFVAAANQGVEEARGKVDLLARPPALDHGVALADIRRPTRQGYLFLPPGMTGRFWVEDEHGVREAELNKQRDRPAVLALAPGRRYYLRGEGREAPFQVPRAGAVVDAGGLGWGDLPLAARGPVEDAFRSRLFSVPFGPSFYRGYVASVGEEPVSIREQLDLTP
ncbi:MAG TPA: caspase family protein [Myxococcaceae bacterium]|nr:caspase family protein [Myxococcaceae bacterium]